MAAPSRRAQRLAGLFALGCLLFNYPLIELFNRPVMVAGIPLLYAYLFCAWAALIALVVVIVERSD